MEITIKIIQIVFGIIATGLLAMAIISVVDTFFTMSKNIAFIRSKMNEIEEIKKLLKERKP